MRRLALLPLVVLVSCVDGSPTADFAIPAKDDALGSGKAASLTGVLDTSASGGIVAASDQRVSLVGEKGRQSETTAESGAFAFHALPPGDYHLVVNLTGFARIDQAVTLAGGQTLDVGTLAPEWLLGKSNGGVLGKVVVPGGDALEARVEALGQPGGERLALVAPAADGSFLAPLPPGTYKLRAVHPLFKPYTTESAFVLEGGKTLDLTATPLVLELNPATLTGTVFEEVDGAQARPAAGVSVTLKLGGATTTTDAQGKFNLGQLVGQPNAVLLTKADYHPAAPIDVALAPGQAATLARADLLLDRATVTGDVELNDQTDLGLVQVRVDGTTHAAVAQRDPAARNKGHFVIENVPPGTYSVVASRQDYADASVSPVVVKGHLALVPVTLPRLVRQGGDFRIEDSDANNTPGFTAKVDVSLVFANLAGASCVRASESQAGLATATCAAYSGAPVAFQLDGAAADGRRTVYAQYENAAGAKSPVLSSTIVLDRLAPSGAKVVVEGGAGFTKSKTTLGVQLEAFDDNGVALMRLSVDGARTAGVLDAPAKPFDRLSSVTRAVTSDGPQDVFAQFFDAAGNASAIVKATVVVDTANPSGTVTLVGPPTAEAGFTNSGLVQLARSIAAEPNGGYVRLYAGNSTLERDAAAPLAVPAGASQSTFPLDTSAAGARDVYVKLVDAAGNEAALSPATIVYDPTPPALAVSLELGALTASPSVSVLVSAADTAGSGFGTKALLVSGDPAFVGATAQPVPSSGKVTVSVAPSTGPADQDRTVYAQLTDRAGNVTSRAVAFTLDQTPPAGRFTIAGTLADGTASSTTTTTLLVRLDVTTLDAAKMYFSNAAIPDCAAVPASSYSAASPTVAAWSLAAGTAGQRTVYGCVLDAAGNAAALAAQSIGYVTSPPSCALAIAGKLADGTTASSTLTATATASWTLSGCTTDATEVAVGGPGLDCAAAIYGPKPASNSGTAALTGPDGAGKKLYACFRGPARLASASPVASTNALTLDTTAPVWLRAPRITNAPTGVVGPSSPALLFDSDASDNLDPGFTMAFTQAPVRSAADCAAIPASAFAAFQTSKSYALVPDAASPEKTYTVAVCLKDAAGNFSVPPQAGFPAVRYDATRPSVAPVLNLPLAQASGVLLSWTDANPDTEHYEIDYWTRLNPSTGQPADLKTFKTPGTGCASAAPSSQLVGPPAVTLTNLATYTFAVRAVDCAGNVGTQTSAPASATVNLGGRTFGDAAAGDVRLVADGADLWAYYPLASGVAATVKRCAPAAVDCRDTTRWASAQVPLVPAADVGAFVASGLPTLAADEETLYLVSRAVNAAGDWKLNVAWCDRLQGCSASADWSIYTLRSGTAASAIGSINEPAATVFGKGVVIGFARLPEAKLTLERCSRTSPGRCRTAAEWKHLDFGLPVDPAYPITLSGTESAPIVGYRASAAGICGPPDASNNCTTFAWANDPANTPHNVGEPVWARCENGCQSTGFCPVYGYNCGDLVVGLAEPNVDALPPTIRQVGGMGFVSYVVRQNGLEAMRVRKCDVRTSLYGECDKVSNNRYSTPFDLFAARPAGARRINAVSALARGSVADSLGLYVSYVETGSGALWLARCNADTASACASGIASGVAGENNPPPGWAVTRLATGGSNAVPASLANVGENPVFTGATSDGSAVAYFPIVPVPYGFFVGPRVGEVQARWEPALAWGGVTMRLGTAVVTSPDPLTGVLAMPSAAGVVVNGTVQTMGALGPSDVSRPSRASAFADVSVALPAGVSLTADHAFAAAAPPRPASAVSPLTIDDNVYVALAHSGGLSIGKLNTASGSFAAPSWALANTFGSWNTVSVDVDYQRNWYKASPLADNSASYAPARRNVPRLGFAGRWGGNGGYFDVCDPQLAPNGCTQPSDWYQQYLGAVAADAQPVIRIAGPNLLVAAADPTNKVLVRYCDDGPAYPRDYCNANFGNPGTYLAPDTCFSAAKGASWKSVTLTSTSPGPTSQIGALAHPNWGWMVAQATQSGISVFACARYTYNGGCGVAANDCSQAANWRELKLPAGMGVRNLDMTASTQGYTPFLAASPFSGAVALSYFDRAWRVATCRGDPDPAFGTSWNCLMSDPAGTTGTAGWASSMTTANQQAPLASAVRVINGDLVGAFLEDGRLALGDCSIGAECSHQSSWRVIGTRSGFSGTGANVRGFLTQDANSKMLLLYPTNAGGTRGISALWNGSFGP